MGRIRQFATSLGAARAVANAGRLQVDRRQEDLAIRRLERVVQRVEQASRTQAGRVA